MYRIENRSAAIQNIQKLLSQNETGIFDEKTRNSVAEHQRTFGLEVTGTVDYNTFKSLIRTYENRTLEDTKNIPLLIEPKFPYKIGDHDSNVSIINSILREIFYDYRLESKLPYGNYYSQDTALAVRELRNIFQMSPGEEISAPLFKRMMYEYEAIKIKKGIS